MHCLAPLCGCVSICHCPAHTLWTLAGHDEARVGFPPSALHAPFTVAQENMGTRDGVSRFAALQDAQQFILCFDSVTRSSKAIQVIR